MPSWTKFRARIAAVALAALGSLPAIAAEPIGVATMLPDGAIEMRLIYRGQSGIVGHGQLTYRPDHKDYRMVLDHLGGLAPGESKPVPPWPDKPATKP